ncbi:MAG: EscU/YscU/HrcU family type III secretion system export apparatus switch protein [Rickettsiales bacterium]|nr:EscU/YscU/HrcU family type III secretion system export apparatus switch protein [Rickettsiales bacterium]
MNDDNEEIRVDLTDSETKGQKPKGIAKAVALQYDQQEDDSPIVTASGKGAIAEQILAIAFAQGIKVREDADLVEILEKIEVDTPIPIEAFTAVAEILSYVYKANASLKQRQASSMHKIDD